MARRTSALQIGLVAGGSVLLIALGGIVLAGWAIGYYFLGMFHDNTAQDAVKPLASVLVAAGGQKLCEDEDAGYGPDNFEPWDDVYYRVPNAPAARKAFFAAAAKAGYDLKVDPTQSQSSVHRSYSTDPKGYGLDVQIWRHTQTLPGCNEYQYGQNAQPVSAYGNYAIYELDSTKPDRTP